jgi:hypothetical protein
LGQGSLRMAVKHPEVFQAVASQEPGPDPALSYDEITLRDKLNQPDALIKQIYGDVCQKSPCNFFPRVFQPRLSGIRP